MTILGRIVRASSRLSTRPLGNGLRAVTVRNTTSPVGRKAPAGGFHINKFSTAAISDDHESGDSSQVPRVVHEGSALSISFSTQGDQCGDDSETAVESLFHAPWLWYSDPSFIHPSSGQRLRRLSQFPGWKIHKVEKVDLESVLLQQQKDEKATIPSPPPPPGCMHSIGTVFQSIQNNRVPKDKHSNSGDNNRADGILLKITWNTQNNDAHNQDNNDVVSYYDWNWLLRCRYDDQARQVRAQRTKITPTNALGRHSSCPDILEVDYLDLFPCHDTSDGLDYDYESAQKDTLLKLLHGIAEQGAALVRNAPFNNFLEYNDNNARGAGTEADEKAAAVAKVGRAVGGGALSHGALYGNLFHVRSLPNAVNIAYTTVALSPHQDLAYFESKPGLQLLHCIRNNQEIIQGGESTLIDAVAAAEYLRKVEPRYFHTLSQCFGTFVKQREGADMVYTRPHIVVGEMGQVVAVHWSPPFEGPPMGIPPDQIEDYFEAYSAFERMLDDHSSSSAFLPPKLDAVCHQYACDYTWERSLEPGDMLIFNNQRMLHGRRGFDLLKDENGSDGHNDTVHRHLAGCYTNIDDALNTYRVLLRDLPDRGERMVREFGNGSSGSL